MPMFEDNGTTENIWRAYQNSQIPVWTVSRPTVPGWYWAKWRFREREQDVISKEIVQVVVNEWDGELCALSSGSGNVYSLNQFTHWLGPLPEPDAPKE